MARYAIVRIGAQQYRVEENSVIEVERLNGLTEGGVTAKEWTVQDVLLVQENGKPKVGRPLVPNASVVFEVLEEVKGPKLISFKIKRRKNYRKKKGHRQILARLRVKSILTGAEV